MITPEEITPGLVLHLDPDALEEKGGTYTCSSNFRVRDGHFFICLLVKDGMGLWIPVYTNDGIGRTKLSTNGRTGHAKWTVGTFYWHKNQVWSATHEAIIEAAAAGQDQSQTDSRNLLAKSELPRPG